MAGRLGDGQESPAPTTFHILTVGVLVVAMAAIASTSCRGKKQERRHFSQYFVRDQKWLSKKPTSPIVPWCREQK